MYYDSSINLLKKKPNVRQVSSTLEPQEVAEAE